MTVVLFFRAKFGYGILTLLGVLFKKGVTCSLLGIVCAPHMLSHHIIQTRSTERVTNRIFENKFTNHLCHSAIQPISCCSTQSPFSLCATPHSARLSYCVERLMTNRRREYRVCNYRDDGVIQSVLVVVFWNYFWTDIANIKIFITHHTSKISHFFKILKNSQKFSKIT